MSTSRRFWVLGFGLVLLVGGSSAWFAMTSVAGAPVGRPALMRPAFWGPPLAWALLFALWSWRRTRPAEAPPPPPPPPRPDPAALAPLLEPLPTPLLLLDAEDRVTWASPAAQELLDAPLEGLRGQSLEALWSGPGLADGHRPRLRKDGTSVPIEVVASPLPYGGPASRMAVLRDVRARPLSSAVLENLVRSSPHPALLCDSGPRVTLANGPAERLFGYGTSEMEGLELGALVPLALRAAHHDHVQAYFQDRQARTMRAGRGLVGLRKDGTEVHLEVGLTPLDSDRGHYTLATVADVTDQRRTEAELRRSNLELEQFAYVASHDLQEPLRMVASFTELLGQRYRGQLDEKADRYIHYAVDGAKRMQQLVADLLAYSRVGSQGKPMGAVDSGAVLARVLEILGPRVRAAQANITADALPVVWADELQLQQLFQNLIGNALKFRREVAPTIHLSARPEGPRWVFSCADNGLGIDTPYQERVFQMFQRLHERGKYEGSGIGLAIAKRILERHDGRIWLESQLGVGTTFFFTLPRPPEVSP